MPNPITSIAEIRKAATACKSEIRLALEYLSVGDTTKAYGAFERAQHNAFSAKSMIANGGKFEEIGESA